MPFFSSDQTSSRLVAFNCSAMFEKYWQFYLLTIFSVLKKGKKFQFIPNFFCDNLYLTLTEFV